MVIAMRTRTAIGMALLTAWTLGAADDYPVLVYPCYRADPAPVLDGQLGEPCWAKAPLVGGLVHYNKPEVADVQTFFRALADDQALYVAVQCDEPLAPKLVKGSPGARDDHAAVFRGEAIELFVDPGHDHASYVQIAFGLSGSLFDGRGTDTSWNSGTKVVTGVGEQGWSAEVAIPWADLGPKKVSPGMVVGFNLCRDRNISEAKQWTTWSRVDANFHDAAHFGHLVLFPTPEIIAGASQAVRLGERQGPIQLFGPEGFSGATYLALAKDALRRLDTTLAELDDLRRKEPPEVAEAIRQRLEQARNQVAAVRRASDSGAALDAAEWLRADTAMATLSAELSSYVWRARLEGLLSGI